MSALTSSELRRVLAIRDLSDPAQGPHCLQLLVDDVVAALTSRWQISARIHRASPIVSIADNYDCLGYPPDSASRDARYTRYVCETAVLRSQTSAMIPGALLEARPHRDDVLLVCPGIVYRRDTIDRLHVGEPHQLDLWRIADGLSTSDLDVMIDVVVHAALPGRVYRTQPAVHPYTTCGRQIDVEVDGAWIEIGECGLAAIAPGLAMGLGLERLAMIRKGLDDIRLLGASDPRIASQMLDLAPYRAVSMMPPVRRDLSIVVDRALDVEQLGDEVRSALGSRAELVEAIDIASTTPYDRLPEAARARLGIGPGQVNLLVRVTLRAIDRSLTHDECNELRDQIYVAVHHGSVYTYASLASEAGRLTMRR